MPDNLRITTPITTNEGLNKLQPPKQPLPPLAVNPSVLDHPGVENQSDQGNAFNTLINRNSVFSKFVEQLNQTPGLSETMQQIMLDLFNRSDDIQNSRVFSPAMKQLAAAMKMGSADILKNLLFQSSNQTKFSAPIFAIFRQISRQYSGSDFDARLTTLLKAYDSFFSIGDTTESIVKELNTLTRQIPNSYGTKVQELTGELNTNQPVERQQENLTVLKEKIIPLLSKYVSATNDFGRARDSITLVVHDTARLNVGSRQELVEQFNNLVDYCRYQLNFTPSKIEEIKTMFIQHLNQASQEPQNHFFSSLISALEESPRQSSSSVNLAVNRDTITSLLLNNSVFMPFTHLFLPINYNGQFLFSEIWIEKNDKDSNASPDFAGRQPTRLLLNFDIKGLGYFEASIELLEKRATVSLSCPVSLADRNMEISRKVSEIFSQNGLTAENVQISAQRSPTTPQKILKKVNERRSGIDVTV